MWRLYYNMSISRGKLSLSASEHCLLAVTMEESVWTGWTGFAVNVLLDLPDLTAVSVSISKRKEWGHIERGVLVDYRASRGLWPPRGSKVSPGSQTDRGDKLFNQWKNSSPCVPCVHWCPWHRKYSLKIPCISPASFSEVRSWERHQSWRFTNVYWFKMTVLTFSAYDISVWAVALLMNVCPLCFTRHRWVPVFPLRLRCHLCGWDQWLPMCLPTRSHWTSMPRV